MILWRLINKMPDLTMDPDKKPNISSEIDQRMKWRTVLLLALVELLVMGLWFSASAVTPSLVGLWDLGGGQGVIANGLTLTLRNGLE